MRKLAIALGVSAAMLVAGGIAWKADATTWRSGTLTLPWGHQELLVDRAGRLLRVGTVPARLQMALRPIQVLVQALLA
jgi:hypothetical protein